MPKIDGFLCLSSEIEIKATRPFCNLFAVKPTGSRFKVYEIYIYTVSDSRLYIDNFFIGNNVKEEREIQGKPFQRSR